MCQHAVRRSAQHSRPAPAPSSSAPLAGAARHSQQSLCTSCTSCTSPRPTLKLGIAGSHWRHVQLQPPGCHAGPQRLPVAGLATACGALRNCLRPGLKRPGPQVGRGSVEQAPPAPRSPLCGTFWALGHMQKIYRSPCPSIVKQQAAERHKAARPHHCRSPSARARLPRRRRVSTQWDLLGAISSCCRAERARTGVLCQSQ